MENKLTAVEFAIEKYEKFINSENGRGEAYFHKQLVKDIEQAKAMDKEQKRKDFTDGYMHGNEPLNHDVINKWYNETYKNK